MIDLIKLQRDIDAVSGPLVALSKSQLSDMIADMRSGQAARLELARTRAFDAVCANIAGGAQA